MINIRYEDFPSVYDSHPLSQRETIILKKGIENCAYKNSFLNIRKDDGYYFFSQKGLDDSLYEYYRLDTLNEIINLISLKSDLIVGNTRGVLKKIRERSIDLKIDNFYLVEWLLLNEEYEIVEQIISKNKHLLEERMKKTLIKTMEMGDLNLSMTLFNLFPHFKDDTSIIEKLLCIVKFDKKDLGYNYLSFILSKINLGVDNWYYLSYFLKMDNQKVTNAIMRNPTLDIELLKSKLTYSDVPRVKIMKNPRIDKDLYLELLFEICKRPGLTDELMELINDEYVDNDCLNKILSLTKWRNKELYDYILTITF